MLFDERLVKHGSGRPLSACHHRSSALGSPKVNEACRHILSDNQLVKPLALLPSVMSGQPDAIINIELARECGKLIQKNRRNASLGNRE
jgi:hypothetical protein